MVYVIPGGATILSLHPMSPPRLAGRPPRQNSSFSSLTLGQIGTSAEFKVWGTLPAPPKPGKAWLVRARLTDNMEIEGPGRGQRCSGG